MLPKARTYIDSKQFLTPFAGIGYAIAIRLAQDGLNVAINDIASKREKIDAVVDQIRALGRESVAVPADVGSETEVKEMVDQTVAALGALDVVRLRSLLFKVLTGLITDGGKRWDRSGKAFPRKYVLLLVKHSRSLFAFATATMEEYDSVMRVNARGVFNCYQSAARQMIAQGRGGNIIGAW